MGFELEVENLGPGRPETVRELSTNNRRIGLAMEIAAVTINQNTTVGCPRSLLKKAVRVFWGLGDFSSRRGFVLEIL